MLLLPCAGVGPFRVPPLRIRAALSPHCIADTHCPTHLAIIMEIKRSALGAHKRYIAADADGAAAVKKIKSISVASIFKQQAKKTKSLNAAPQMNLGATSPVAKDEPVRKVNTSKLLSSSRSPHKSISRASKKRLDHPLLVEFKGTSLQTAKLPRF
jgi:hypothetical protein